MANREIPRALDAVGLKPVAAGVLARWRTETRGGGALAPRTLLLIRRLRRRGGGAHVLDDEDFFARGAVAEVAPRCLLDRSRVLAEPLGIGAQSGIFRPQPTEVGGKRGVLAASVEQGCQAPAAEERLDHQRDAEDDEAQLDEAANAPSWAWRGRPWRGTSPRALNAGILNHWSSRYASRREKYSLN